MAQSGSAKASAIHYQARARSDKPHPGSDRFGIIISLHFLELKQAGILTHKSSFFDWIDYLGVEISAFSEFAASCQSRVKFFIFNFRYALILMLLQAEERTYGVSTHSIQT
jgi:hypothetical protein